MKIAIFDCDNTLTAMEGIDALAALNGVGEAVEALTSQAMNGEVSYSDIFAKRLAMVHPTAPQLEQVGQQYIEQLVPGARETVALLQSLSYQVGIVSGGFTQPIQMLAVELNIAPDWVFAVDLDFDAAGQYHDYQDQYGLATLEGKAHVMRSLRQRWLPSRLVMTGDGLTDLVCLPDVDTFVGYGGCCARPRIQAEATHYCAERDMLRVLAHLLTDEELSDVASKSPDIYSRIRGAQDAE